MREFLFKAKRVDNGDWCYGVPLVDGWSKTTYIASYEYSSLAFVQQIEVIPETLCEFTGLTDKNGKRIFEGDIICKGFECFVVKWNSNQCRWGLFDKQDFEVSGFNEHTKNYLEIIGNRFDNPELLTAERIGENDEAN